MTCKKLLGKWLLVLLAIVAIICAAFAACFMAFAISGLFGFDLPFELIGRVLSLSGEDVEALRAFAWLCGIILILAFIFDFLPKMFSKRKGRL